MSEKQLKLNQSVEKAFAIIEIMSKGNREMKLQDIAREADLPQATALRIIYTLMTLGYVLQNEDTLKYSLSLKFCYIGSRIESQLDIRFLVKPHLIEISRLSGEASCLSVEDNGDLLYVESVDGEDNILTITQKIGKRAPLYCTGAGKIYLAKMSKDELEIYLNHHSLIKLTEHTKTTRVQIYEELNKITIDGYSIDDEECELGVKCIAMPIRNYRQEIIATMSVTGPASRLTDEKMELIKKFLLEKQKEVESVLAYQ